MPAAKVASRLSEHYHTAAGHVLAAVVAYTLHHGRHTGVAHCESLAHTTVDIYLAACRAIKQGVAGDGVLLRLEVAAHRRQNSNASAAQSFAQIVVGLAFQLETDAVGQERTETLTGRTFEFHVDGLFRQSFLPVFRGNHTRQHRAYRTVGIGDGVFQ